MRKIIALASLLMMLALLLTACGKERRELVDMTSAVVEGKWRTVLWEERTYEPFCVVSKNDRGEQIGYVDGDTNDRVSAYKDHPPEEWLVSWLPMDGGAMLLREQGVTDIPEGLEQEYY